MGRVLEEGLGTGGQLVDVEDVHIGHRRVVAAVERIDRHRSEKVAGVAGEVCRPSQRSPNRAGVKHRRGPLGRGVDQPEERLMARVNRQPQIAGRSQAGTGTHSDQLVPVHISTLAAFAVVAVDVRHVGCSAVDGQRDVGGQRRVNCDVGCQSLNRPGPRRRR